MLKYPCLVLDHDDTVVQSEATVNYPCFCNFLELHRPDTSISLADYVAACNKMTFVEMCKARFGMTDAELEEEYRYWKAYVREHSPEVFPGIADVLQSYRKAGGKICVSSMSAEENILRDYRIHFGFTPDLVFGWDLPEDKRKPSTYALEQIMQHFNLRADEILVIDDMKFAVGMARAAGCPIAFAGWGRRDFPDICSEMEALCDFSFDSTEKLKKFLFD